MDPREPYTTFDIKEKLGVGIERQKDWRERGFIKPTLMEAKGQGTKNLFSRFDLYTIKLFESLVDWGYPRKRASQIVAAVRNLKKIADEKPLGVKWNQGYMQAKEAMGNFNYIVIPWNMKSRPILSIRGKDLELPILPIVAVEELNLYMATFKDVDEVRIINFKKIKDFVDSALK
jgi:hypothetical protein